MSGAVSRAIWRLPHLYWRFSRGMTLGVRAAAIDPEGRVGLVRHTYTSGWYLPGGGVEPGETTGEAVRRELAEEAGIVVDADAVPELHGIYWNAAASRRDHVVLYVVRRFCVPVPKVPDREIAEAAFFPIHALPPDATRATRERLREIVDAGTPSPTW